MIIYRWFLSLNIPIDWDSGPMGTRYLDLRQTWWSPPLRYIFWLKNIRMLDRNTMETFGALGFTIHLKMKINYDKLLGPPIPNPWAQTAAEPKWLSQTSETIGKPPWTMDLWIQYGHSVRIPFDWILVLAVSQYKTHHVFFKVMFHIRIAMSYCFIDPLLLKVFKTLEAMTTGALPCMVDARSSLDWGVPSIQAT